uniref:Uncharacterized protein n=1 Tax=Oryza glumipatula TaxID=40148 RepID=A0A0D9YXS8_9ORYZ
MVWAPHISFFLFFLLSSLLLSGAALDGGEAAGGGVVERDRHRRVGGERGVGDAVAERRGLDSGCGGGGVAGGVTERVVQARLHVHGCRRRARAHVRGSAAVTRRCPWHPPLPPPSPPPPARLARTSHCAEGERGGDGRRERGGVGGDAVGRSRHGTWV